MPDDEFQQWLMAPPGKLVLEQGAEIIRGWVPNVFGYRLAQLGTVPWVGPDPLDLSPIRHQIRIDTALEGRPSTALVATPEYLPFANDSVDLVVLPFTLDGCSDPKQVLREVERVLIPNGRLISLGFNPWSLWGLRRLVAKAGRRPKPPWNSDFIGYVRLGDWLSLLGMDVEKTDVAVFRPPASTEALLRRMAFIDKPGRRFWPMLAGVYAVQAVKRVHWVTPIRPARKRLRRFGNRVLEPTTRGY